VKIKYGDEIMKRIISVLIVHSLIFFFYFIFVNHFYKPINHFNQNNKSERTKEERNIYKTLFSYQILKHIPANEKTVVYLFANDQNPDDEIIKYVERGNINVRGGYLIYPSSINNNYSYSENYFILRLGRIRWVKNNETFVVGSYSKGYKVSSFIYHIVKFNNDWNVSDIEEID